MKTYRIFFAVLFAFGLTAFVNGDYAELEGLINARAGFNFTKSADNIKFQVPKGTVGKIESSKLFNSGNYGLEITLQNGKNKGEKVFVYYTPQSPNMKITKENPLDGKPAAAAKLAETKPEAGKIVTTILPVRAYRAPAVATKSEVAKPAMPASGIDAATTAAVASGLKNLQQATAPKKCENCEVAMAGKGSDKKCEEKRTTVGNLEIYQSMTNGVCEAGVYPTKAFKAANPGLRDYNVYGDGHFESIDGYGVKGYYFFPRKNEVGYLVTGNSVFLSTASDVKIEISTETGKVINVIPATKWKEYDRNDDEKNPKEKEHLVLDSIPGVMVMDLQYTMGAFPERRKRNSAILRSPDGKSCQISNPLLFKYNEPDGILDTVDFKFKTDQEFESFYKKQCKW